MSDLLSKDQLRSKPVLPTAYVLCSEWGGRVKVRGLTGEERDAFDTETGVIQKSGRPVTENFRGRFVAWCLCDDNGELLFVTRSAKGRLELESGAAEMIGGKGTVDLQRVYKIAATLNGLGEDDDDGEDDAGN